MGNASPRPTSESLGSSFEQRLDVFQYLLQNHTYDAESDSGQTTSSRRSTSRKPKRTEDLTLPRENYSGSVVAFPEEKVGLQTGKKIAQAMSMVSTTINGIARVKSGKRPGRDIQHVRSRPKIKQIRSKKSFISPGLKKLSFVVNSVSGSFSREKDVIAQKAKRASKDLQSKKAIAKTMSRNRSHSARQSSLRRSGPQSPSQPNPRSGRQPQNSGSYVQNADSQKRQKKVFRVRDIKQLMKYLKPRNLSDGEILFRAGESADACFFVSLGEVNLWHNYQDIDSDAGSCVGTLVDTPEQRSAVIRTLLEGEILGAGDMLNGWKYPCTARARGEATVFELTREGFEQIKDKSFAKPIARRFKYVLEFTKLEKMKTIPLLHNIEPKLLRVVANLLRVEVFSPGRTFIKEGKKGKRVYFILEGEVVLTIKDKFGFDTELATVKKGNCVGERSFMSGNNCICSITTLTEVQTFSLDQHEFHKFVKFLPAVKRTLVRRQEVFSNVDSLLREVEIFSDLSPKKKNIFGYLVHEMQFLSDQVIIQQGKRRKREEVLLHIIAEGNAEIFINGIRKKVLQRGNYFGELDMVSDEHMNTATVRVSKGQKLRCYTLTKKDFDKLLSDEPALFAEICINVLGKKTPLSQLLRHPVTKESFAGHCHKEFSAENINFWLAVKDLEALEKVDLGQRLIKGLRLNAGELYRRKDRLLQNMAMEIFRTYVDDDSPQEINIEGPQRAAIIEKVKNNEFSFDMFAEAKTAIYKLMDNDIFSRYKTSAKFTAVLKKFRNYQCSDDVSKQALMNSTTFHSMVARTVSNPSILTDL